MLWVEDPPLRSSAAARSGAGAVRSGVRRGLPLAGDARAGGAIKLALMDNHIVVGVGQHLCERSAVPRGHPADDAAPTVSRARLARLVDEVRAVLHGGDREGRQHAARLRGRSRRARLFPARLLRLRPRRRAVPGLRNRHPPSAAGRAGDLLLPGLPAIGPSASSARRRPGRRNSARPRADRWHRRLLPRGRESRTMRPRSGFPCAAQPVAPSGRIGLQSA